MYVRLDYGIEITHKTHLCLVLEGLDESIRAGLVSLKSPLAASSATSQNVLFIFRKTLPLLRTTNKNERKNDTSDRVMQESAKVSSSHLQLHNLGVCMVFISTENLRYIWNKGEWKIHYIVHHAFLTGIKTRCVMVAFLLVVVAAIADGPLIQRLTRTVTGDHTVALQGDWAHFNRVLGDWTGKVDDTAPSEHL
jgi:hypothetical protein